jgi:glycosyltransferase involved in cell wall biosynthesis
MNISCGRNLLYVSHLPRSPTGGGVYTVSWNIARLLEEYFAVADPGPITTPTDYLVTLISKLRRRVLRLPAKFHAFSPRVLSSISREIDRIPQKGLDGIFFRSSTRWCECRPTIPYFIHTDVPFRTFFHNTFSERDFHKQDLQRIYALEREFMAKAQIVFFESDWGLQKAREALQLDGTNFRVAHNGGGLVPPDSDLWDGKSQKLVTIAKDFKQKGGDLVCEAFKILKPRYPNLEWHIIGGKPLESTTKIQGIHYEGFLRPSVPEELQRFRILMENAFLLVHPTREDTNPLVLIEAAYFGCPSISVRDFAIPELVLDNQTGYLIDRPFSGAEIAKKIEEAILSPNYRVMRSEARNYSMRHFTWQATGELIAAEIHTALEKCKS